MAGDDRLRALRARARKHGFTMRNYYGDYRLIPRGGDTRRAAYLATRLDQALAARGKRRALLHYAAHNGTGAHVHD
jgi:hypothetical protein